MKFCVILLLLTLNVFAQTDLTKLVETEKTFAQTALEKGTKTAFLEFLADDGVLFHPDRVNGKESWKNRPDSPALLVWTPEFADISANGVIGYTTGPWEFRPNGKNDSPTAFGHFVSVWQRQQNGNYKVVLDIGISHEKVSLANDWKPSTQTPNSDEKKSSAADISAYFFELADSAGFEKAYKTYLADDVRLYREGKLPISGKKNALDEIKKFKNKIKFNKRSMFIGAGNLGYLSNSYTVLDKSGKELEKGNFLQIWRLRKGKWEIVLDLFSPIS